jgi:hypothetical protein
LVFLQINDVGVFEPMKNKHTLDHADNGNPAFVGLNNLFYSILPHPRTQRLGKATKNNHS